MICRQLSLYLMVTSVGIVGSHFRGPHHPSSRVDHRDHAHPQLNKSKKIMHDSKVLHDRRHIAEDLKQTEFDQSEDLSSMEMDFQFFRLHDLDENKKLDGIELYQAMLHQLERADVHSSSEGDEKNQEKEDEEQNLARIIDEALEECDINNDGYLSYSEFKAGRARAYARGAESDEI